MLDVTFYGVRGSTPCNGPGIARYGGNTSCVMVRVPDEAPLICDLGTGVRYLGESLPPGAPFVGTALVSHLHWDHIQGLPFFNPVLRPGAELEIVGPVQDGVTLEAAFSAGLAPPLFPVKLADLPGSFRFRETSNGEFSIGSATIKVFPVTHVGPTNGYRIDCGRASVAYISDFQQPIDGSLELSDVVIEACRGVDILIHDAQYNPEEFAVKSSWGHCTVEYAVEVAKAAAAERLVLYHHDPAHNDEWVDEAAGFAAGRAGGACEVMAAAEGLTLHSGR
ncbi:MAG: MBL fold metallo-hydrolase [Acidimicrobiales bacterium]